MNRVQCGKRIGMQVDTGRHPAKRDPVVTETPVRLQEIADLKPKRPETGMLDASEFRRERGAI
jgi:hypothetical protein